MSLPLRHFLLALAVVAVWGTNFVVIRVALDHLPPLLFATLRFTLVLLPMAFFVKRPAVSWKNLAAYGVLIGAGQFGLLFVAMKGHISPGLASLVVQTQVFFTIGMAMKISGEKVQPFQIVALLLAASGIVLIAAHGGGAATPLGVLLILLAAASWAGGNIVARAGRHGEHAGLCGLGQPVLDPAAVFDVAVAGGLAGHRGGRDPRRRPDLGRGGLAGGGQHHVRLCGLGLAAGPAPGRHGHADGPAGAGVRHGRLGHPAAREPAAVETGGGGPGADGAGGQHAVAETQDAVLGGGLIFDPLIPANAGTQMEWL
jgi:hypothetical protein